MMENNSTTSKDNNGINVTVFDYDNTDWPRDFDIRIEVAEQREVLENV
jgi:hypothetical protein